MNQNNSDDSVEKPEFNRTDMQSNISGPVKQGSKVKPGTPTTSIVNAEGQAIAWEVIEERCRVIGVTNAAKEFKIERQAIQTRKDRHKWKGIPDGRSIALGVQGSSETITEAPGDFTRRITAHRERVFKIASNSLGKKKSIPINNARDYEIVDRIARRAAGINDEDVATANVLIHINEAIEDHEAPKPIEAHEVIPCATESSDTQPQQLSEPVKQKPLLQLKHSNVSTETLNAGDSSRRQFVLPGGAK